MSTSRAGSLLPRLVAVVLALHVVGIVVERVWGVPRDSGLLRQLDLNAEGNATSWFGSLLLLVAAVVAHVIAASTRADDPGQARRWTALSVLLAVMSLDESAQLHDLATGPLRRALDTDLGLFHFAWVLPGSLLLALALCYLAPLSRSLERDERLRLLRAAAVYVTGAVVLEMLGGLVVDVDVDERGYTWPYLTALTVEESLELIGAALLIGALLHVAARRGARLVLDLAAPTSGADRGGRLSPARR